MKKRYFVYILSNEKRTLYTGVTSDIQARVFRHRSGLGSRFTNKHDIYRLVWFEETDEVQVAIAREKQLKRWHRRWKLNLIEAANPGWADLAEAWYGSADPETSSG